MSHPRIDPFEIEYKHFEAWFADMEWKPNTRRGYRSSVRVFYGWAHRRGLITVDPTDDVPVIKVPRAMPRPAPNDVVDDGLRTNDIRVSLMILLLTDTGVRRGELSRVHTDDVERDLNGSNLRVTGKGGHVRLVPINEQLAATLRLLPRGYIFPGKIDGHLSASYVGKLVSRALADGWTAHTLRHRFASLAYAVDCDIRAVQELLGHASVSTTQIYTLVLPGAMRRAAAGARVGLTAISYQRASEALGTHLEPGARERAVVEAARQAYETALANLPVDVRNDMLTSHPIAIPPAAA